VLTLFTIPKPFKGHIDVTQRNALKSWTRLAPQVEVIVFGEEQGTAEVCRELGLRHEPQVECNEFGTPFLNFAFHRAQQIARHDWLCYANCDIILMGDFRRAFERLKAWRDMFMMVGQRWDTDVTEPLDFSNPDWERQLHQKASASGNQRGPDWIDYFVFKRGQCAGLPPFVVGRPCWDHWLVWWMRHQRIPVVDASAVVKAVHQNHDYSYHPEGAKGAREGPEFKRNRELVGSWRHMNTLDDATYAFGPRGIRRTYGHWGTQFQREWTNLRNQFLVATGPLRRRLGLSRESLVRFFNTK
jgi:hypothetical protein